MSTQAWLDFDGDDRESKLRLHWAANAARERAFYTPDRLLVCWMQGSTATDSDMAWFYRQPVYKQQNWRWLVEYERIEMARRKMPRRSFHVVAAEWEEIIDERARQDEESIARFMKVIREDFLAGRPCSIDLSTADPWIRQRAKDNLAEAFDRLSFSTPEHVR